MLSFTEFCGRFSQTDSRSTCRRDRGKTRPVLESLEARALQSALTLAPTGGAGGGKHPIEVHSISVAEIVVTK
jgi:hypothetical protein